jgi:hypothetical protein
MMNEDPVVLYKTGSHCTGMREDTSAAAEV